MSIRHMHHLTNKELITCKADMSEVVCLRLSINTVWFSGMKDYWIILTNCFRLGIWVVWPQGRPV
jgi:hypothetical protein